MEFWAFSERRFRPMGGNICKVGDTLEFFFGNKKVAEATVAMIEAPGHSVCEHSGKFKNHWKVFWQPETFIDLRD